MEPRAELQELVEIMARLRAPDGCPWDAQQTLDTLKTFLLEESYEVLEAIEKGDPQAHCEELGDLLFQIVFQCQLAREKGWFDIWQVIGAVAGKIKRRHPHVFGQEKVENAEQVVANWERIKKAEKSGRASALDGLPQALPALLFAHRLSERAARVGFDWQNAQQVQEKVEEEMAELREAMAARDLQAIEHELGDLLFALSNLARHLKLAAEDCLRSACRRFVRRFNLLEKMAAERAIHLPSASLDTLEGLWQEAKKSLPE
jgi:MazG family protein